MDAVDVRDDGVELADRVVVEREQVGERARADLAQRGLLT